MPSDTAADLLVRPASLDDADALATLYLDAREAAYPAIPRGVHPPDDVRRWWRGHVEPSAGEGTEVWLAEDPAQPGAPVAVMLLEDDWLHSLYVAPGRTGEGTGSLLVDLAKTRRPRRLGLYVFASNPRALAFYAHHGFVEVGRGDGTGPQGNEEGQPDVELTWPDPASLAGLRGRMDELDDRLARLLAERAEVTALVQRVKDVPGHAGRDPQREAEIARRMAALAPALGEERLRRIMHVVIGESLDADPLPDSRTRPSEENR